MAERGELVSAIESLHRKGRRIALATIVDVRGSAYRQPGARLVLSTSGAMAGNISAGCLEEDVAAVGRAVMADGRARLTSFDLTADEEAMWGWGLGCNGAIDVLIEPDWGALQTARIIRDVLDHGRPAAVPTLLEDAAPEVPRGTRMVVHPDGRRMGTLGSHRLDAAAAAEAMEALRTGISATSIVQGPTAMARVFVEVVHPPLRLLVCGAGPDAIPLVKAGTALGWRIEVADDRPHLLTRRRFPGATRLVHVTAPADAAREAGVDKRTYVVVMSHHYLRDQAYLRSFLATDAPYIGMLGPRRRLERLVEDLATAGIRPSSKDLDRIHGPAGLDVGAMDPDEIASSILAEVLAVSRGRGGGFLKDRRSPIHAEPWILPRAAPARPTAR